ncbi:MAG: D-alanine--D-alanine ligase [Chitinophagaceae bacterium]|jgi:D-alanine-D-alanine ligase
MNKPVIAFVTGGYSSEAVISYKSAITIEKNLDATKFDVYRIDITPDAWFHPTATGEKIPVKRDDFTIEINGNKIRFDAVFIGIHGTPGEDGKLQGYFDLLNLPYTSCDATSSAITFNKRYTTAVAGASGFHVAKSIHLFQSNYRKEDIGSWDLKFPVFVKPNNGGSSIGMSRVNVREELEAGIEKAFKEDDQVLIEEFIAGREFTIGVFKSKGAVITLPFTEIITENEFFDFEAKYQGKSKEVTPAECSQDTADKVRKAAAGIYSVFNCRGVVRMDFIFNDVDKIPYLLEINTVPGQSAASIVPQQVAAMGVSLTDFYSMLIEEALEAIKK